MGRFIKRVQGNPPAWCGRWGEEVNAARVRTFIPKPDLQPMRANLSKPPWHEAPRGHRLGLSHSPQAPQQLVTCLTLNTGVNAASTNKQETPRVPGLNRKVKSTNRRRKMNVWTLPTNSHVSYTLFQANAYSPQEGGA